MRNYGIEDPFPDLISKLRRFMGGYGVPIVGCQEPLVECRSINAKEATTSRGKLRKYAIPYLLAKYAKLTLAFLFCS